jgi:hypothetical protein
MRPTPLIAAALSAALLLAACGKSPQEAAVSAASGGKVEQDGDTTTIKTDEGDLKISSESGQSLPASFPKDVYLPSGYSIQSSMDMADKAQMLQFTAPGNAADASAAAGKAMPGMGWEQKMSMQQGGVHVLMFENSDSVASYQFSDNPDGGGTMVVLSVSRKE